MKITCNYSSFISDVFFALTLSISKLFLINISFLIRVDIEDSLTSDNFLNFESITGFVCFKKFERVKYRNLSKGIASLHSGWKF